MVDFKKVSMAWWILEQVKFIIYMKMIEILTVLKHRTGIISTTDQA